MLWSNHCVGEKKTVCILDTEIVWTETFVPQQGREMLTLTDPMAGNKAFPNLDLFPCATGICPRTVEMFPIFSSISNVNRYLGKLSIYSLPRPGVPESSHQWKTSQSVTLFFFLFYFFIFNFLSLVNLSHGVWSYFMVNIFFFFRDWVVPSLLKAGVTITICFHAKELQVMLSAVWLQVMLSPNLKPCHQLPRACPSRRSDRNVSLPKSHCILCCPHAALLRSTLQAEDCVSGEWGDKLARSEVLWWFLAGDDASNMEPDPGLPVIAARRSLVSMALQKKQKQQQKRHEGAGVKTLRVLS